MARGTDNFIPIKGTPSKFYGRSQKNPLSQPEHWVNRWENQQLSSPDEEISASKAIKHSGLHIASKRYSDFVNQVSEKYGDY